MNWLPMVGAFVAGVIVCGAIFAVWHIRSRRADKTEGGRVLGESELPMPTVRWLDGESSPTGRRVLDCRAVALGVQLATPASEVMDKFIEITHSDGSELQGNSPPNAWLVDVDWDFDADEADQIEDGLCPQVTEDLWRIDCIGPHLYFRRSWTGQLVFMTNYHRIPAAGARITRIWTPGEEPFRDQSPEYMSAYVRHLLDTHLLNIATPFPIPPGFPDDRQKIAALVFYSVGRRGWLAEYFDNTEPSTGSQPVV